MPITLSVLERAWQLKDPALVDYIVTVANQTDPEPTVPIRAEAPSFKRFLQTIVSVNFLQKPYAEQMAWRIEQLRLLSAEDAEVPLAEQLKLHAMLMLLWTENDFYARAVLLEVIRRVPLVYGPWKALKHVFKAAEQQHDYELLATIAVRLDSSTQYAFSTPTMLYMRRRAWRYLRKLGQTLPVVYPEAACYFLAAYPENTAWAQTWIANHIFYHATKAYGVYGFKSISPKLTKLDKRAFKETWLRTPEPLLRLLLKARAETIRQYACDALKADFKIPLRDIDSQWLMHLSALPLRSKAIDHLISWLLQNSPKWEQHQFRELGLHAVVLPLLTSEDKEAQHYAIHYVKAHARDLTLNELLHLAHNNSKELQSLVQQLITERDARNDIGLTAWGELLETQAHYEFAAAALRKHFGRKELTPDWFMQRLVQPNGLGYRFAQQYLLELYPAKGLGVDYFKQLLNQLTTSYADNAQSIADFALKQLAQLDISTLEPEFIQTALLNPLTTKQIKQWLSYDTYPAKQLPMDFYKALVYEPDWQNHPFIQQLKQLKSEWVNDLYFDPELADTVRGWLSDVRRFAAADIGFAWLMQLVNREEPAYHDFAVKLMIKAFTPADFAPKTPNVAQPLTTSKTIDLAQQTFLFTGKLSTMTRAEAETKVVAANGKNAGAVTAKLDYLVIGDDGSPLYGNGRKGSKQLKAEKLLAEGATLKIISETVFLQMLSGNTVEHSVDDALAGCQTLWQLATVKPDTPVSKFAIQYLRNHHAGLALKLNDKPVDPGAELPTSFLTFAQFKPLFQQAHTPLRQFALDIAQYEFVRWQPSAADLISLSESKYSDVREFVSQALSAKPEAENKTYRLDTAQWAVDDVYSFCEAKSAHTRQLGIHLIQQHSAFQIPAALFQLTESPDRELRHLAVRSLWSLYKRYSTTRTWQPRLSLMAGLTKTDQAKQAQAQANLGKGLPTKLTDLPASEASLQALLRRWLFTLPPGPLGIQRLTLKPKPLSASKAKLALIETCRDIALDDREFAEMIWPLLAQFTHSLSLMERQACLVALTRLRHVHPQLSGAASYA